MRCKLFNKIERTVVLTLDKRLNNTAKLISQCINYGLYPELFICGRNRIADICYDYIDSEHINFSSMWSSGNTYSWNCFLAYKSIIYNALKDDIEYLLILEDDVVFREDSIAIIEEKERGIKKLDFDILHFGGFVGHESFRYERLTKYLYRVNCLYGGMGGIFRKNVLEELFNIPPICSLDNYIATTKHNSFIYIPTILEENYSISSNINPYNERNYSDVIFLSDEEKESNIKKAKQQEEYLRSNPPHPQKSKGYNGIISYTHI
jgi:hypothetical protein